MHIAWESLGLVFLVSFGAAVGVVVLFSLGVAVLAPATQSSAPTQSSAGRVRELPAGTRYTAAALCFTACALVVGYGLYVIIAK